MTDQEQGVTGRPPEYFHTYEGNENMPGVPPWAPPLTRSIIKECVVNNSLPFPAWPHSPWHGLMVAKNLDLLARHDCLNPRDHRKGLVLGVIHDMGYLLTESAIFPFPPQCHPDAGVLLMLGFVNLREYINKMFNRTAILSSLKTRGLAHYFKEIGYPRFLTIQEYIEVIAHIVPHSSSVLSASARAYLALVRAADRAAGLGAIGLLRAAYFSIESWRQLRLDEIYSEMGDPHIEEIKLSEVGVDAVQNRWIVEHQLLPFLMSHSDERQKMIEACRELCTWYEGDGQKVDSMPQVAQECFRAKYMYVLEFLKRLQGMQG